MDPVCDQSGFEKLMAKAKACTLCEAHLPLGPRPVFAAHTQSKLLIIGQAPGIKVHQSGVPWDDVSGRNLRAWLDLTAAEFYDPRLVAILPMGFCYPGKGKSGDLPPRPECEPAWHPSFLAQMPSVQMTLLLGRYAQEHYLRPAKGTSLTELVRNWRDVAPRFWPLPHPSPRNRFWQAKNPWFAAEVLPELQAHVRHLKDGLKETAP